MPADVRASEMHSKAGRYPAGLSPSGGEQGSRHHPSTMVPGKTLMRAGRGLQHVAKSVATPLHGERNKVPPPYRGGGRDIALSGSRGGRGRWTRVGVRVAVRWCRQSARSAACTLSTPAAGTEGQLTGLTIRRRRGTTGAAAVVAWPRRCAWADSGTCSTTRRCCRPDDPPALVGRGRAPGCHLSSRTRFRERGPVMP